METVSTPKTPAKYNLAPLDNSVVFKKLFRDAEVLNAFIKDLLNLDLDIQPEQIQTEKKFTPPIGNVDIAYDIFVDDPVNRIIIEIQRVYYSDHYDRFFYYFLAAILERAQSYKNYQESHAVYTIVWLTRKVREKRNQRSIITERIIRETNRGELHHERAHRLIFLNPHYVDDQTPASVVDWMQLVTESLENPKSPALNFSRPIINKATFLIDGDGLTPQERADLIDETNYQENLVSKREEGVKEGLEKGIKIGELQTLRSLVKTMLFQKFSDLQEGGLPQWLTERIDSTDNAEQFHIWIAQIVVATSLDAVFQE